MILMLYDLNVGFTVGFLHGGVNPSSEDDEDDHVIGVP
jgi:hypothetical protein